MLQLEYWIRKIINVDSDILEYISYIYFVTFLIVIFLLQIVSAPYGRYARSGWGCMINAKLAWFIQEIPSFLVPVYLIVASDKWSALSSCSKVALVCFLTHYFQRSLVFPFLIRGGKPTPFAPFIMALAFCVVNGYLQGGYILYHSQRNYSCLQSPHFIIGLIMFLSGMLINIHSDHVLRNLRKPGDTGYVIPKGGMFDYVSGANFFGEILEWWGFFVLSPSLPSLAFAVFTTSNIGPRSLQHHRSLVFPFLIRGGKSTPFAPFIMALAFCVVNGYLQGGYILYHSQITNSCLQSPHFIIGLIMFLSGMLINIHSDHVLRNLRKPGDTGYVIPKGGMFDYVSGANFFGEILEWWGFFVLSPSLPSLAFAVFTTSNIGPRALQHHRWYLQKFEDYPKKRKAIVPFLF